MKFISDGIVAKWENKSKKQFIELHEVNSGYKIHCDHKNREIFKFDPVGSLDNVIKAIEVEICYADITLKRVY